MSGGPGDEASAGVGAGVGRARWEDGALSPEVSTAHHAEGTLAVPDGDREEGLCPTCQARPWADGFCHRAAGWPQAADVTSAARGERHG